MLPGRVVRLSQEVMKENSKIGNDKCSVMWYNRINKRKEGVLVGGRKKDKDNVRPVLGKGVRVYL